MIMTKDDLRYYLNEDRKAYAKKEHYSLKERIVNKLFPDSNWEYIKCLRKLEYYTNNKKLRRFYWTKKWEKLTHRTGIHLVPNIAGPGLHIPHGNVIISGSSKVEQIVKYSSMSPLDG